MTFRTRLLLVSAITMSLPVALVAWIVSDVTRRAFEESGRQSAANIADQFRREFERRSTEVASRLQRIAASEAMRAIALDMARPDADYAPYYDSASLLAGEHGLDFLEIVGQEGAIVSSAQWPARFGYRSDAPRHAVEPFLAKQQLPAGTALGLMAVRPVVVGDATLYLAGGQRLDRQFLGSLALPAGTRAFLYLNLEPGFQPAALVDANNFVKDADKLRPLLDEVRAGSHERSAVVDWGQESDSVQAVPLTGRDKSLLGVFFVATSRGPLQQLVSFIRKVGFAAGAGGIVLGLVLGWWATARVTRPVKELADAARRVAAGDWSTRVAVHSGDEVGQLAAGFNRMTQQLAEQRDRLVQAERVAAWRELARRLAHELKNPLFPLQITIENLQRSRALPADEFDEVFEESTQALLAELANLKTIIQRFSDFSKMPPPQLQPCDINEVAANALRVLEAQFERASIAVVKKLTPELPQAMADPEQVGRAIRNLVLNAMDAMPGGGTLAIRTCRHEGFVRLEIADSGQGLTAEECERLFTPYYTTKQHGTGLGLAIVQSVVSDHNGRIAVESAPGAGTTFRIDLPVA
jgi:signal transduction histidine kinase